MTAVSRFDNVVLGLALGLPCVTSLWLMIWAPGAITSSTYAVAATLLLATAAIVINTWRNAQATGSVGQLLFEVDTEGVAHRRVTNRWERWLKRYDRSAARGRTLALLALSLASSSALVTAWLA
jgi:hypothetical protein